MKGALRKNAKGILLMLLCSLCLCLGQLAWKLMAGFDLWYFIIGFAFCGVGALMMIIAYRFGEMSVLQPINSMSYVFTLLLAHFVLQEMITPKELLGVFVVILGVALIGSGGE